MIMCNGNIKSLPLLVVWVGRVVSDHLYSYDQNYGYPEYGTYVGNSYQNNSLDQYQGTQRSRYYYEDQLSSYS